MSDRLNDIKAELERIAVGDVRESVFCGDVRWLVAELEWSRSWSDALLVRIKSWRALVQEKDDAIAALEAAVTQNARATRDCDPTSAPTKTEAARRWLENVMDGPHDVDWRGVATLERERVLALTEERDDWKALAESRALTQSRRSLTALHRIHALMDGREWSADTLDEIAAIVREMGLVIREPDAT